MNLDLSKIKKIFFIGIGGIGISALAKLTQSRGVEVSGLNDEEGGKTLDALREAGIPVIFQTDFRGLPEADLYVYSDAWLYRGPEILASARATGKPVLSYFEALGLFAKEYDVIAVAGVHGKTTTTAMIADMLIDVGLDPTVVVGSFVEKFGSNFRAGKGRWLVVEADEYMRHFLNFTPKITVITNIEADHLDYYKDLADIQDAFGSLMRQTGDVIVYNGEDENTCVLVRTYSGTAVDFSRYFDTVPALAVPGVHNRKNAAAALAVADLVGIDGAAAARSLADFRGTWRRLEKRGVTPTGTIVYDDYAHHPTEVRASLEALRELYPKGEKKIHIIFQPHLYSRTKALWNDFLTAFGEADTVAFLPIYFAREDPDPEITNNKLAEAIGAHQGSVTAITFEDARKYVTGLGLGKDDILVTMGAGEAYKIGDAILAD